MKLENKEQLKKDEGLRLRRYQDTKGLWTIYYGHLIKAGEIFLNTIEQAEEFLDADIAIAEKDAKDIFPEFKSFAESRQDAIIMLLFNMGKTKIVRLFPRMVHCMNIQHWDDAADELKYADGKSVLSKWYGDVKSGRAEGILNLLREG